ncbi:hypothetical protein C7W93_17855 [Glaciimonas sp. PCH181]|nr:hypothetical protein C7W93_17855 [Glaciimonas sp. PCH181]
MRAEPLVADEYQRRLSNHRGRMSAAFAATAQLQVKLRRLRQEFSELHQESLSAPFDQRHGTGLLLSIRDCEPKGFEALRRRG